MIYEESELIKIKDLVKAITMYLHDELLINNSESLEKITRVRNSLSQVASDFAGYVIEASFKLNYTMRVNNFLADLFIHLRWIVGNDSTFMQAITNILLQSITSQPGLVNVANTLLSEFYESYKTLSLNFISINSFRQVFSSFVEKFIENIIKHS